MDLYGFSVNEHSPSMEKKIYYCKIMNDIRQMSKHIPIYQTYQKRGSLHAVVEWALEDRMDMLDPIIRYVSDILQSHDVYYYDPARLMDACDMVSGCYVDACMALQEACCEVTNCAAELKQLRELRKAARTRVGAIGQGFSGLAVGMLKAGTINMATGLFHSAFNVVGNLYTRWQCEEGLERLYELPQNWEMLRNALGQDCAQLPRIIGDILSVEVGPDWAYPFTQERAEQAMSIIQQMEEGRIPKEKWPRLVVDTVVNAIPFDPEVYFRCADLMEGNIDGIYQAARLFHVEDFYGALDRKAEKRRHDREEKARRQSVPEWFFGEDLTAAKIFLNRSNADDSLYYLVEDQLSPDFNDMIKILLDHRMFIVGGKPEGELFDRAARRYLRLFEFDIPTVLARQREIAQYFTLCKAKASEGERAYTFINRSCGTSKNGGLLITDRGLYSTLFPGFRLDYEGIDVIRCGILDSLELVYRGKTLDLKLPHHNKVNAFLVLACMYFKYGKRIGEQRE